MRGNKRKLTDEELEKAVTDAIGMAFGIPQTPENVQAAEKELEASRVDLPSGLADPYRVLDQPSRRIRFRNPFEVDQDPGLEENLAQAARDGGEISPEVKQQMQRDREAAEKDDNG